MTDLHGTYSSWMITVACPLTPQPVRVQISPDDLSGYSETVIGWAPVRDLAQDGDQVRFHGAAGAAEGAFHLVATGGEVHGTFTMERPFAGTFPASGHAVPALRTITTVDEAVDIRGPYSPVVREPAPLPDYTVYRPNDDARHPVVVWGNGGGSLSNEGALTLLSQVAAAGFVVIAPGDPSARSAAVMNDARPEVLRTAIDWAAEGSERYLDGSRVAVMGHSMGGVQSWHAAAHPAVASLACWNGSSGPGQHLPAVAQAVRVPTLIVTGGPTDGAHGSSVYDFDALAYGVPAVLIENVVSGHAGLFHGTNDYEAVLAGVSPASQELEVVASVLAVRWLRFTLLGDVDSGAYFLGEAPVIGGVQGWKVSKQRGFGLGSFR